MQLDPKGKLAARQAYQTEVSNRDMWHADGGPDDTPMEAAIRAYFEAAPSPGPAPAQVTDAMIEAACIEFLRRSPYDVDWSIQTEGYKNVRRQHMRAALTAAIGAGGQAVAESLSHEDENYLQEIADGAWGDDPRVRGLAPDRLSALSHPPQPAERVVEDERVRREMEEILNKQSERDIPFAPASAQEGRNG